MKTSLVFHGREINVGLEPLWEKKKREEIVSSPKNQHSGYEQLFSGPCRLDKLVWVEYSCLCMWLISMSPVPKIVGLCQSHVGLTKNGILQPRAVLMSQRAGCTASTVPLSDMETTAPAGKQGSVPFHEASGAKEFANMAYFLDYMIAFQEHVMKNYRFKEMSLWKGSIL